MNQALECVGAEEAAAQTGQQRIVCLGVLFGQPLPKRSDDVTAQGRATCFAPLAHTVNVSTDTELDITAAQGPQLTVTQPGLDGDEQKRAVPATEPRGQVRCGQERCGFLFVEKLDRALDVPLGRDGQHLLAL